VPDLRRVAEHGLASASSVADEVTAASAPRTVYASNMGKAGPPGSYMWSGTEIASNPASSAARAASASRPNTAAPSSTPWVSK
jgi:hypothetical protein